MNQSLLKYNVLEKWCHSFLSSGRWLETDSNGKSRFYELVAEEASTIGYPTESVLSLLRNIHVRNMKCSHHQIISKGRRLYLKRFLDQGRTLLNIAQELNHPPYIVVKTVLDLLCENNLISQEQKVAFTSSVLQDPWTSSSAVVQQPMTITSGINVTRSTNNNETINQNIDIQQQQQQQQQLQLCRRLSVEMVEALQADTMDGPYHSRECNMLGVEYEIRLQQRLRDMDVPFESEEDLRNRGTSKTPDILLSIPLGIKRGDQWKRICWIDSKALFGDVKTHELNVLPQAYQYLHRFGPGLILYWFGYAPCLQDDNDDVIIAAWDLPKYFMLPTGDFIGCGTVQLASYFEQEEEEE